MNLKKIFFASVIVLSANASFAQDTNAASHTVNINIPNVALLDLESTLGNDFALTGTVTEAGEALAFGSEATNATIWMNYSSIVKGGGINAVLRNVSVAITGAGTVPAGLKLTVLANPYSGSGKGKIGTPKAIITLDSSLQQIIEGIGSAYTGDGIDNGHKLTYQLGYAGTATDYADLDFDNSNAIEITYTLSEI